MPDPLDNLKATGDTHDPKLDSPAERSGVKPEERRDGGAAADDTGDIKDKEAGTSDSYGDTRDSGERPR